jgi:hypothetical protein
MMQAIMQLLQQGGNVFNPTQNTPVVGQSGTDKAMGWANVLATLWQSGLLGDIAKGVKGIGDDKTWFGSNSGGGGFTGGPGSVWYGPNPPAGYRQGSNGYWFPPVNYTGQGTVPNKYGR